MGRTLIVGDVHGCLDELDALLERCRFDAAVDQLVFVGDLVAKGLTVRDAAVRLKVGKTALYDALRLSTA